MEPPMTPRTTPMTRLGRFQRGEDAAVEPLTAQRQVEPLDLATRVQESRLGSDRGMARSASGVPLHRQGHSPRREPRTPHVLARIPVHQLDHLLADPVQVRTQLHQHLRGHPVTLAEQPEQHVLGADVVVTELQ